MDKTSNHVQYSLLNNILHNKRLNRDEIEKNNIYYKRS